MTHTTPQQVMRDVTTDIILRALKLARRKQRTIYISKTANGQGMDIATLDPRTAAGRIELDAFLRSPARHYTISGLGEPEEPNAINWRQLNLSAPRKVLALLQVAVSFFLKGTPFKNRWYRWMGCHIGKNVEIMQMAWLDHFRPELIFIGDNTLLGAFTRITCHALKAAANFAMVWSRLVLAAPLVPVPASASSASKTTCALCPAPRCLPTWRAFVPVRWWVTTRRA